MCRGSGERRTPPRRPWPGHPSPAGTSPGRARDEPSTAPARLQHGSSRPPGSPSLPYCFPLFAPILPPSCSPPLSHAAAQHLHRGADGAQPGGTAGGRAPESFHRDMSKAALRLSSRVADTLPSPPHNKKKFKNKFKKGKKKKKKKKLSKRKNQKCDVSVGPPRPGFQPGCSGKAGGSSYNPQAGRAGRPPGAASTAPRLPLGSSDASAPLRLPPPPPPRSRAAAAASPGRPPPATCCPGREEREARPQTFVSGRRLLPAPSAAGLGREGMHGGRMEPAPALKDTALGTGPPGRCPLAVPAGRPGGNGCGACTHRPAQSGPARASSRRAGPELSVLHLRGTPGPVRLPGADRKSPWVGGSRTAGPLTSRSLRLLRSSSCFLPANGIPTGTQFQGSTPGLCRRIVEKLSNC